MSKSNKNAATEDAMGVLHNAVTRAFTKKVDRMLQESEEKPEDMLFIIDEKTLNAAANFLKNNEITCALPESDEASPLAKSLAAIRAKQKAKVIPFVDEMKGAHG
jgi:hypothetical protein